MTVRPGRAGAALDTFLDRSVVLGYSRIGYAVRRRLPDWPADPPADALSGQHVVVTGASSGLGTATAQGLARLGAHVHLVVRDTDKGGAVRRSLQRLLPTAAFELWRCDVSNLDDVLRFAGELRSAVPSLAGLVHNAGVMPSSRSESAQGHELAMSVHVLGPLAMTEALLGPLAAAGGRVVLVTSGGMYGQSLPVHDPEYRGGTYRPATAYARSKRVQVGVLPELARRWGARGVQVYATHPGWADTPGIVESLPGFRRVTGPVLRDPEQGADTTVWLTAVRPAPESGRLWHDRRARRDFLLPWVKDTDSDRTAIWAWVRDSARLQP